MNNGLTSTAIGIDLGTTSSCVAVYQNGKVKIISNPEGYKHTPSEVAFKDYERLYGNGAKNQAALNPERSIFNVKRLMGRKCNGSEIMSDNYPFNVIKLKNESEPVIKVRQPKKKPKSFRPEEISGMILRKMKETAERYLLHKVTEAVITVPACFSQRQRQATMDAAKIAGLNVLQLINEPTAAALTYAMEKGITSNQKVLVFDFGGGTLDVTILHITPSYEFTVISTSGDSHFGGADFDQMLIRHFVDEFYEKYRIDITKFPRSMRRLRTACEGTKKVLSTNRDSLIEVDALYQTIDFLSKITRTEFEGLCTNLFSNVLNHVRRALQNANMPKSEIDTILLVGGSTRIPKVQQLLEEFFDGKPLNSYINPDEAVAYGAAIQAAVLTGIRTGPFGPIRIHDVSNLSFGTEGNRGQMLKIVPRNTHTFTPICARCENIIANRNFLKFYEGESNMASKNHKLGEFKLKSPRKYDDVIFEVNQNGLLLVTVRNHSKNKREVVNISKDRLSDKDFKLIAEETMKHENKERKYKKRMEAKHNLEEYLNKIEDLLDKNGQLLSDNDRRIMFQAAQKYGIFLKNNKTAKMNDYVSKLCAFQKTCDPIITNRKKKFKIVY